MDNEWCRNCHWFESVGNGDVHGVCHVDPPVVVIGEVERTNGVFEFRYSSEFPSVGIGDFCSRFKQQLIEQSGETNG